MEQLVEHTVMEMQKTSLVELVPAVDLCQEITQNSDALQSRTLTGNVQPAKQLVRSITECQLGKSRFRSASARRHSKGWFRKCENQGNL